MTPISQIANAEPATNRATTTGARSSASTFQQEVATRLHDLDNRLERLANGESPVDDSTAEAADLGNGGVPSATGGGPLHGVYGGDLHAPWGGWALTRAPGGHSPWGDVSGWGSRGGSQFTAGVQQLVAEAARTYGVDPSLALAVAKAESGFNPHAVSPAGAQGVMQLMPGTAQALGVKAAFDAQQNVDGGVRYLRQMLDRFGGDVRRALAAYNAGPGAVDKYGGVPPYRETQAYVERVMGHQARFRDTPLPAAGLSGVSVTESNGDELPFIQPNDAQALQAELAAPFAPAGARAAVSTEGEATTGASRGSPPNIAPSPTGQAAGTATVPGAGVARAGDLSATPGNPAATGEGQPGVDSVPAPSSRPLGQTWTDQLERVPTVGAQGVRQHRADGMPTAGLQVEEALRATTRAAGTTVDLRPSGLGQPAGPATTDANPSVMGVAPLAGAAATGDSRGDVGASGLPNGAGEQAGAPEVPVEPEVPEAGPQRGQPVRHLTSEVPDPDGGEPTRVRVSMPAGGRSANEVQVAVRVDDRQVANALRDEAPALREQLLRHELEMGQFTATDSSSRSFDESDTTEEQQVVGALRASHRPLASRRPAIHREGLWA